MELKVKSLKKSTKKHKNNKSFDNLDDGPIEESKSDD